MKHRTFTHPWLAGLLAGEKVISGYNVSKFGNKTKRVFKPNVQRIPFYSEILKSQIVFPVSQSALFHIDSAGGIDQYLLKTPPYYLQSIIALKWRRVLRNAIAGTLSDPT